LKGQVRAITPKDPGYEVFRWRRKIEELLEKGVPRRIGIAEGGLDELAVVGDGEGMARLDERFLLESAQVGLQRSGRFHVRRFRRRGPELETRFERLG
jgi:hypothetical protein